MSLSLIFVYLLFYYFIYLFSHFKDYISIFGEFIPQMLFLLCIFGWLVVLMFVKWIVAYSPIFTVSVILCHILSYCVIIAVCL